VSEFDLDKYLRASGRVDLDGVRWDLVREYPLPPEAARCLAYMMDIESHTVIYLRDLLATDAAFDPEVTAFLSCWVYEELWHGEAFSRFLGEAGYRTSPDAETPAWDAAYPTRSRRNAWIRRGVGGRGTASHVATLVASRFVPDFVAVHMTWGAINELSTLTGYHRLMAKTKHPVLRDVLSRIVKDERRHFAFYRAQARMRLARSAAVRRLTRAVLERLWAPVGSGVRPQAETDFAVLWLFGDEDGAVAVEEIDATIRELPGFEDAHLARRALANARRRSGIRARHAPPLAAHL
jgi:rubrerythrin